jgi:hypothetical protein
VVEGQKLNPKLRVEFVNLEITGAARYGKPAAPKHQTFDIHYLRAKSRPRNYFFQKSGAPPNRNAGLRFRTKYPFSEHAGPETAAASRLQAPTAARASAASGVLR